MVMQAPHPAFIGADAQYYTSNLEVFATAKLKRLEGLERLLV
jgi:hypothetical protein